MTYTDTVSVQMGYNLMSKWQLFLAELFFQTHPEFQKENFLEPSARKKYIPRNPQIRQPTRYNQLDKLLPHEVLRRFLAQTCTLDLLFNFNEVLCMPEEVTPVVATEEVEDVADVGSKKKRNRNAAYAARRTAAR